MVQKSKLLGKPPLILITTGTTLFDFCRLYEAVDEALATLSFDPEVVSQQTLLKYRWKHNEIRQCIEIRPPELIKLIKKADRIITHGGFGTLHLISLYSKYMPLVVPRLSAYGEHIDDHQQYFIRFIKKKFPDEYKSGFFTSGDLKRIIRAYLVIKPKNNILNRYLFNGNGAKMLANNIANYINGKNNR